MIMSHTVWASFLFVWPVAMTNISPPSDMTTSCRPSHETYLGPCSDWQSKGHASSPETFPFEKQHEKEPCLFVASAQTIHLWWSTHLLLHDTFLTLIQWTCISDMTPVPEESTCTPPPPPPQAPESALRFFFVFFCPWAVNTSSFKVNRPKISLLHKHTHSHAHAHAHTTHTRWIELKRLHFVPPPLNQSSSIQQFDLLFKTGLSPSLVFIQSFSLSLLLSSLAPQPVSRGDPHDEGNCNNLLNAMATVVR